MAKKISNLIYSLIFAIFVLSSLGTFIYNADSLFTNHDSVGSVLLEIGENSTNSYLNTETNLQDSTFETGTFSLPETQNVETRGTTQGITIARDAPATATSAIKSMGSYIYIHPLITGLIISLIVTTGIILGIRLWLGDGRA